MYIHLFLSLFALSLHRHNSELTLCCFYYIAYVQREARLWMRVTDHSTRKLENIYENEVILINEKDIP